MSSRPLELPAARGTLLSLAAALAFGVTTPLVQLLVRRGAGADPFATAMLLYAGASAVGFATRSKNEARVERRHAWRLLAVAASGALVAPSLLAWGLAHTSGTSASLMLNAEALFTIVLARALYREHVGARIAGAAVLLAAGGVLLVLDRATGTSGAGQAPSVAGLVAVAGAALFWAVDNALAKPLSALDPAAVVAAKGAIGAALSLSGSLVFGLATGRRVGPGPLGDALALVLVGAVGYGASLRLYLLAQREIGAGRTASVFAAAPFCGAALAWALGEPTTILTGVSAVTMVLGLVLHLTEQHHHEHAHRHDDGHHDHAHEPMPEGVHTHRHRHDRLVHAHPHTPDMHHEHEHS